MPRKRQPARLYWRSDERQWVIRDGTIQKRTGAGAGERGKAENALAAYLADRPGPERSGPSRPSELSVGEVLARYADDKGAGMTAAATLAYSISALIPFWGDKMCDEVKGSNCRRYAVVRNRAPGTTRRELGVFQASINHAHAEGILLHPIKVQLPEAGASRDRWLTRPEVARLLRSAAPHVRRFILISIYTGRRAGAVLDLEWSRVDLDADVIRFRAEGQAETNKRRGRAKMPRQLRAHLRRWKRLHDAHPNRVREEAHHVILHRGKKVGCIKKGIARAAERAGLEGVTPHVLKHTAVTWPIMRGLGLEDAAEFFDTSAETIRRHYWHHSPHHQERAVQMVEGKR